jgi:NADH-quinone oxidoreductase subunit J
MIVFWMLAPLVVLAALGMVMVRKAVHAALCLAIVMISLAVMYAAQGAPFLFAVQIIVYTGAIMMLFLFVLMLVGIDADDSVSMGAEQGPKQRVAAAVVGLAFGVTAVVTIGQGVATKVVGLDAANAEGNPVGIARLLFGKYVLAFEFTSALLITAVLGAMVLAHRERLGKRLTQADFAARRMTDYAESGKHPGAPSTPGVYAGGNAVDTPARLPDGSPMLGSLPRSLMDSFGPDAGAGAAEALERGMEDPQ